MPPGRRPEAVRRAATFLASDDGPARGSRVLVAVSGGPDSTALASVLAELASDYALALVLGHVAHGLRSPDDEEADAAAVRALGACLGLPVLTRRVDLPAGGDLEARARRVRRRALRDMARESGAGFVALGHTRDDQAETVLMRLLRGAGRRGLAGMRSRTGAVVRPLLEATRSDVRWYLAERGLVSTVDRTNAQLRFTRNRVRRLLLPLLAAEFNPRIDETLAALATRLRDEDDVLDAEAGRHAAALVAGERLRDAVAGLPPALGRRVVRRWLGELGIRRVTAGHVERTLALARGGARGVVALPGPARVVREAGALVCRAGRAPSDATFAVALSPGAAVDGPGWRLVLGERRPWHAGDPMAPADGQALLDADAISGPLSVRSPRRGDRVRIAGVGTRKLHDVLVDRKIPREARAGLPVLAAGEVLLWVPGVVRTAAARVNAATRAVIEARFVASAAQPREAHDKPALPLAKPCGSIRRRSECT